MQQPVRLIKSHHKIHVLDSLAGSTLYKIIDCRDKNQTVVAIIQLEPNVAVVGATHVQRVRLFVKGTDTDKSPSGIDRLITVDNNLGFKSSCRCCEK